MIRIVLLGAGNVGKHLFNAFYTVENVSVVQVYNRSEEALAELQGKTETTTSLSTLKTADVYLVSVKDDAVEEMIKQVAFLNGIVAHTSGSVPLLDIAKKNGVFYPLQTFSKEVKVDFSGIPFCLEASNNESYATLEKVAKSISQYTYSISTQQRKSLHLSAVFVCNFVNHLYSIGETLCNENKVPFEVLHALIKETARKATVNSPKKVQTGPAVRNDQQTIKSHLSQLTSQEFKEIYTLLTHSIQATHGKKL